MMRAMPFLAVFFLVGCEPEGLTIVIHSADLEIGEEIDAIRLDMVATLDNETSSDAKTCRPYRETVEEDLTFPFTIAVHPGERSWECLGIKVEGRLEGREIIYNEALFCAGFDTHRVETILLEKRCLAENLSCGDLEFCRAGECYPSRVGGLFAGDPEVDQPCHE